MGNLLSLPPEPRKPPTMETLPPEMVQEIYKWLPLRDCRRLGSTCHRLHEMLPTAIDSLKINKLVIHDENDILPVEFVKRYLDITEIHAHVGNFDESYARKLKALCESCPNLRVLALGNGKEDADVESLNELFQNVAVEEFRCWLEPRAAVVIPRGVEKCSLPIIRSGDFTTNQTSLATLRSLDLRFARRFDQYSTIWCILSELPLLEDLTLRGYGQFPPLNDVISGSVTSLRLDLRLSAEDLSRFLGRFPVLEVLKLDVNHLGASTSSHAAFTWPKSMRELYIYGIPRQQLLLESLLNACRNHDSLKIVSQDLPLPYIGALHSPSFVQRTWSDLYEAGLFKDMYLPIRTPEDWTTVLSILRRVPELDRLHLFTEPGQRSPLMKASPEIATSVARLSVDGGDAETILNIFSSFSNVTEYSISTNSRVEGNSVVIRREKDAVAEFAGHLHLTNLTGQAGWLNRHLRRHLYTYFTVTHFTLWQITSSSTVDFEELYVIAPNLVELTLIGPTFSDSPLVDPDQLPIVLKFPKIEKFSFLNVCRADYEGLLEKLKNAKSPLAWPEHLKEIRIHQRGKHYSLRATHSRLGIKVYFSSASTDAYGFQVFLTDQNRKSTDRRQPYNCGV